MTTPNHNGSYDDPPPSYDSLFKNVATKRAEGAGVLGCTREVTKAYQSKMPGIVNLVLCGICGSLVGFALPLSELVIGSLYFELCPAEDRLPVFLVVSGVVGMVTTSCCCGLLISFCKKRDLCHLLVYPIYYFSLCMADMW
ncbi:hypothetical protein EB796_005402 [Bugula neritina]|uniref:Uncharacterized protein n=1 Tax=Bugula neritina TaxID=10212 RepID=A0A7J7KF92_BUGNE|nr:hypothetical protein EB796_005402 [Bugula neritina]